MRRRIELELVELQLGIRTERDQAVVDEGNTDRAIGTGRNQIILENLVAGRGMMRRTGARHIDGAGGILDLANRLGSQGVTWDQNSENDEKICAPHENSPESQRAVHQAEKAEASITGLPM